MHPLLTPTTHADLELCARELTMSGYYDGDSGQCYLKMLMGVTLGATILESIHGVQIEDKKVIVRRELVERLLKRAGITVTIDQQVGVSVSVTFDKSGRKLGTMTVAVSPDLSADVAYELALIRGIREHLFDVFAHKFYLRCELTPVVPTPTAAHPAGAEHPLLPQVQAQMQHISRIPVTTADKLAVPRHPSKLALAKDSQTLLDWQKSIHSLSIEHPAEWEEHLFKLNNFSFLTDEQKGDQFAELVRIGQESAVGWDVEKQRFYLAETPVLE